MSNPWTKKNPLMSMWLSAANKAAGSARGQATAAAKRQVASSQADLSRQIVDFWTGTTRAAVKSKPSAKKSRR
ncbi:hypothetical protein [Variovorax sp. KK3]|uniref:hypothetical protein n=1 Tax=Variovorax sp. KK3 TaxID=1855728 RepID=UPI00097C31DA|nr:hypothetical protein [Variovorax sp. KK3]